MNFYYSFSICILSILFIACILYYYLVKKNIGKINFIEHFILCFSLFTIISPIILLQFDINTVDSAIDVEKILYTSWIVIFVLTQIFAWIILPILEEYSKSQKNNFYDKIKEAIWINVKLYIIISIVVLIILFIGFVFRLYDNNSIVSYGIDISNLSGICLLILFLSHGLSEIPKEHIKHFLIDNKLNFHYAELGNLLEIKKNNNNDSCKEKLDELILQEKNNIKLCKNNVSYKIFNYVVTIIFSILSMFIIFNQFCISLNYANINILLLSFINANVIVGFIIISYMIYCIIWSYFQISIFDNTVYAMGYFNVTQLSNIFVFLTRLVLPLCYDYLWMTNINQRKYTRFIKFYGYMELTKHFNIILHIIIPVIIVFISIGLYFNLSFIKIAYAVILRNDKIMDDFDEQMYKIEGENYYNSIISIS
jgi:hypothetical protein